MTFLRLIRITRWVMITFHLKFALTGNPAVAHLLCCVKLLRHPTRSWDWKAFAVCLYSCTPSAAQLHHRWIFTDSGHSARFCHHWRSLRGCLRRCAGGAMIMGFSHGGQPLAPPRPRRRRGRGGLEFGINHSIVIVARNRRQGLFTPARAVNHLR